MPSNQEAFFKLALAGVLALTACRSAPQPAPQRPLADDPASAVAADPWELLLSGRLDDARQTFHDAGPEGIEGRLALARIRRDLGEAEALLAGVAAHASDTLVLEAGTTAMELGLRTAPALAVARRACALASKPALAARAGTVCAKLALTEHAAGTNLCAAGCQDEHRLPLLFAANSPVVEISVNEHDPLLFIVDTGASTSLLTRSAAAALGVEAVAGTRHEGHGSTGTFPTEHALVEMALGGLRLSNVDVVLLELPYGSIAGILSPHTSLPGLAVTFDFPAAGLRVAPKAPSAGDDVALPLAFCDGNPLVFVEAEGRPTRPFLVDTGASATRFHERYDELGAPLPRKAETLSMGAGGGKRTSWRTDARFAARLGDLSFTLTNPTIVASGGEAERFDRFGLLGMDFMFGRRITIDPMAGRLLISREATLSPWKPGASARFAIRGSALPSPFTYEETVSEQRDGWVQIAARLASAQADTRFEFLMPDGWASRGTWLVTRPVASAWREEQGRREELDRKAAIGLLAKAFVPFKSLPGEARLEVLRARLDGRSLSCTETTLPAQGPAGEAALSLVECPSEPWRTARLRLTSGGTQVWELVREGFDDGREAR